MEPPFGDDEGDAICIVWSNLRGFVWELQPNSKSTLFLKINLNYFHVFFLMEFLKFN